MAKVKKPVSSMGYVNRLKILTSPFDIKTIRAS
jgi:hypothetical protein